MKGYFHFCFEPEVIGSIDDSIGCVDNENWKIIYETDISPFGSTHDRACEFY